MMNLLTLYGFSFTIMEYCVFLFPYVFQAHNTIESFSRNDFLKVSLLPAQSSSFDRILPMVLFMTLHITIILL